MNHSKTRPLYKSFKWPSPFQTYQLSLINFCVLILDIKHECSLNCCWHKYYACTPPLPVFEGNISVAHESYSHLQFIASCTRNDLCQKPETIYLNSVLQYSVEQLETNAVCIPSMFIIQPHSIPTKSIVIMYACVCIREESKRYRNERNIYRTKYQAVKEHCTCGIMEKFRNGKLSGINESGHYKVYLIA